MNEFLSDVKATILREKFPKPGTRLIVALSGGADSVALLVALHDLGYECVAAHCDFHLRGEESERDRAYAEKIASVYAVRYHVIHFDVESYRKARGVSIEMACRDLRYDWFRKLSEQEDGAPVAVAHHHDDNVETMLLNLMRGTGIAGLTGMKYRNGIILRPLLNRTRKEIENFLAVRNIPYVTDSTNLLCDVKRNKLRNIILPAIKNEFPDAGKGLATSLRNLRDNEALYRRLTIKESRRYISPEGIMIEHLKSSCDIPATLLFEMIKDYGFNYTQASDIINTTASGRHFTSPTHEAVISRGTLLINPRAKALPDILPLDIDPSRQATLPHWLEVETVGREQFIPDRTGNTLYLSPEALDGKPRWQLRRWHPGDRIAPFGMKGTRLLSDIFNDAKLSPREKTEVTVLTRDGEILWIIGSRTSQHFPVTPTTTAILRFRLRK